MPLRIFGGLLLVILGLFQIFFCLCFLLVSSVSFLVSLLVSVVLCFFCWFRWFAMFFKCGSCLLCGLAFQVMFLVNFSCQFFF